jgi:hypothetical protein
MPSPQSLKLWVALVYLRLSPTFFELIFYSNSAPATPTYGPFGCAPATIRLLISSLFVAVLGCGSDLALGAIIALLSLWASVSIIKQAMAELKQVSA